MDWPYTYIQVVCIRDFPGIGGVIFKCDKIYLGKKFAYDGSLAIEYNKLDSALFTNGEHDPIFRAHFKFFTG